MERKAVNDAVAYIRGLAELRGRNVEWAEAAVREGASLPADEALAAGVIDLVAADMPELLRLLDGRKVKLQRRRKSSCAPRASSCTRSSPTGAPTCCR